MSLKNVTSDLLHTLSIAIDAHATSLLYHSFNSTQISNKTFLSEKLCNLRGTFYEDDLTCKCDIAMFGLHCQRLGVDSWKGWFTFFKVIFGIIYGILTVMCIVSLVFKVQADIKVNNKCQKIKRMILTPKYIVIFNLIIVTISRFFYVIVDPFCQRQVSTHRGDTTTFFLSIPPFASFYCELFVVWSGINSVFVDEKNKKTKKCYKWIYTRIKPAFFVLIILFYVAVVIYFLLTANRVSTTGKSAAIISVISFAVVVVVGFLIYLIFNLKYKIYKLFENEERNNFDLKQLKGDSMKKEVDNKEEVIDFINELQKANRMELIDMYIIDKGKIIDEDELEYKINYEKEIINLDVYNQEKYANEIMTDRGNSQRCISLTEEASLKRSSTLSSEKSKTATLTQSDKKVILKIFGMTIYFMVMSFIVEILLMNLVSNEDHDGESAVLVLLHFFFGCEASCIVMVYYLFFKSMNVQEYKNLKIIGKIDKYMNENSNGIQIIKYDDFTRASVFARFKHFVQV